MENEPIKLILKPNTFWGYFCYSGDCPECGEEIEIEDVEGVIICEGCGNLLVCELER